jgi:hypothetical protein
MIKQCVADVGREAVDRLGVPDEAGCLMRKSGLVDRASDWLGLGLLLSGTWTVVVCDSG